MRRTLAVTLAAILTIAAGCDRGSKPNPKPKKTHTVPIDAIVMICVDPVSVTRWKDQLCESNDEAYRWIYVTYSPTWPKELPAVNELLEMSRGDWALPKNDRLLVKIPAQGAFFQ
jgi:hypothetical protein